MTMRDFGVGKKSLEGRVLDEMRMTAEVIEAFKGQPFETTKYMAEATANVMYTIIFGARFDSIIYCSSPLSYFNFWSCQDEFRWNVYRK